ncbi:MAG: hypothetical protein LQ341_000316 [Variospora aurantia]|nr:MAG: hypothetical protein LQ341_000316 [Variospora aurantia]
MLYTVRLGQGAIILPRDVQRIHLEFAFKFNNGHFGARKVWRNILPRLKYHNPAVSITINRSIDQADPANLTIFYASPKDPDTAASSTPSSPAMQSKLTSNHTSFERTETINMKHKHELDVLSELMDLTKARPVAATPEAATELQQLANEERRSAADRARNAAYTEQRRQEKALLDQARGEVGPA